MHIKIKNVAKILDADVTLKGLTVIAGYNNMGKSTILKALYVTLNTFRSFSRKVLNVRKRSIRSFLMDQESYFDKMGYGWLPRNLLDIIAQKVNERISDFMGENPEDYILFRDIFNESVDIYRDLATEDGNNTAVEIDDFIRPLYEKIKEICSRDKGGDLKYIADMYIRNVFKGQINSLHNSSDATINIDSDKEHYYMLIKENRVSEFSSNVNSEPEVFYLPSYNLLDMIERNSLGLNLYSPEYDIRVALYSPEKGEPTYEEYQEIEDNTKLIKEIFEEVVHGKLERQKSGNILYKDEDMNDLIGVGNIASGMKTFLIIQALVERGKLKKNSILLIDEPETNLHPEWHLKFAEILVLLYKNMGVRSIVNSHSPYFIRALEVKMADYSVKEDGNFYLMEEPEKNIFKINDVTKNTDKIYKTLYKPLQYL